MALSGDLADCDAATSRSSAKRVAGVVSKFNDMKKKLVCEIGFSGILHMPQINKTPRKFSVWLLSNVDIEKRSIVVNGSCKVALNDKAFHRVLGIPCGPKKLVGLDSNELQDKIDFIKLALGSVSTDPMETCSLKVAEDILTMNYDRGMNKEQIDRFKVAFVVFVVGHFLTAKTRTNHGMEEFWGSLLNTEEIHLHNFCSIVIDEILESAKRVQAELKAKRTIKNVTGCTLGLQVLYLDSLNLNGFNLPPDILPRISLFDLVLLKKMINADQQNNITYCQSDTSAYDQKNVSSGLKRVRFEGGSFSESGTSSKEVIPFFFKTPQPAVSSYLTAYLRGSIEQRLSLGQVDALKWHNARMIYQVRRTKEKLLEGGGFSFNEEGYKSIIEVHMEELMSKIFQDNFSLAKRLHSEATIMKANKNPIASSSTNLSSHNNLITSEGQSSAGGRSVKGSSNSTKDSFAEKSLFSTPIVGKKLFQDGSNTSAKKIKQEDVAPCTENSAERTDRSNCLEPFIMSEKDITAIVEHGSRICLQNGISGNVSCAVNKLKCRQKRLAPNPWQLGRPRKIVDTCVTSELYCWLQNNNMSTLRSNWIIHALPKYIELDGLMLKDIFIKRKNFGTEAFDIAIRRMVQLDRFMYGTGRRLCWRHIMESDFAMMILGGMDPLECVSIIYQFTMRFNEYDISECRMIIIPAVVNGTWCVYYWDMEEEKIHVIDSMCMIPRTKAFEEMHGLNINKIQYCLANIISLLFDGWKINWTEFKTEFVDPMMKSPRRGDDGLMTLLAIQEYDGAKFVEAQNEETIAEFNKLVLYEMVSLEGNYGKIPCGFIQSLS